MSYVLTFFGYDEDDIEFHGRCETDCLPNFDELESLEKKLEKELELNQVFIENIFQVADED